MDMILQVSKLEPKLVVGNIFTVKLKFTPEFIANFGIGRLWYQTMYTLKRGYKENGLFVYRCNSR